MTSSPRATGVIKLQAVLLPPKRGGFFQRTRASIVVNTCFTTFTRSGEKKNHTGMSFVRKWLATPPRFSSRMTKVKLHITTNLPLMKSIDISTFWLLPRAGHKGRTARSTIRVNCI